MQKHLQRFEMLGEGRCRVRELARGKSVAGEQVAEFVLDGRLRNRQHGQQQRASGERNHAHQNDRQAFVTRQPHQAIFKRLEHYTSRRYWNSSISAKFDCTDAMVSPRCSMRSGCTWPRSAAMRR